MCIFDVFQRLFRLRLCPELFKVISIFINFHYSYVSLSARSLHICISKMHFKLDDLTLGHPPPHIRYLFKISPKPKSGAKAIS